MIIISQTYFKPVMYRASNGIKLRKKQTFSCVNFSLFLLFVVVIGGGDSGLHWTYAEGFLVKIVNGFKQLPTFAEK